LRADKFLTSAGQHSDHEDLAGREARVRVQGHGGQGGRKATQDECDPKLPLPPWELDARNPEAFAFAEKTVDPNTLTGPLKSVDEVMALTEQSQKDVAGIK
jgi:hypothetical protein